MSDAEMSRFTRPRKLGERETIRSLLPYLWPRNEMELRVRVVAAIVCLFIAKIANVYVPVLYKHAIDALGSDGRDDRGAAGRPDPGLWPGPRPVAGLRRTARRHLRQGRAARDPQRSRSTSSGTCTRCRCASIWSARPAGLSRSIERGTNGIQTLLSLHAVQHPADAVRDPAGLRRSCGGCSTLVRAGDARHGRACTSPIPWSSPSGGRSSAAR